MKIAIKIDKIVYEIVIIVSNKLLPVPLLNLSVK